MTAAGIAAGNVIDTAKLSLFGERGFAHTLTSGSVSANSSTAIGITLSTTDKIFINGLLNQNGTSPVTGAAFNLSAASGWNTSVAGTAADATNPVTVSNVTAPSITRVSYDMATGRLSGVGSNLVKTDGSNNDITASKFTFSGEGGATYTLSTTGNFETSSANTFTFALTGADIAAVNALFNKNGTASTFGATYNFAAADDWNSVITGGDISVATTAVTVSNVPLPGITSATYDAAAGTLARW